MVIETDLDKNDVNILKELSKDLTMSYTTLSNKIGFSRAGIKTRLEKMLESGVIKNYGIVVDHKKAGYDITGVVKANIKINEKSQKGFIDDFINDRNVIGIYNNAEGNEIIIIVRCNSQLQYDNLIQRIKTSLHVKYTVSECQVDVIKEDFSSASVFPEVNNDDKSNTN